jgi:hypothetical protein
MRSALAVVAGYLIFAVCSFALFRVAGQDPHAAASFRFEAFTIVCGIIFAGIGGYVTGRLAPQKPLLHGVVLAAVMALLAAGSMLSVRESGSRWTQISAIFLMAPAAVVSSAAGRGRRV